MRASKTALALLLLGASLAAGCGQKPSDLDNMSKADQEKAFKGDPSKMPADVRAKVAGLTTPGASQPPLPANAGQPAAPAPSGGQ